MKCIHQKLYSQIGLKLCLMLYGVLFVILKEVYSAEYPCNNFVIMDYQIRSPCVNSKSYSYNLKKMSEMGGDVLRTSTKITISGWWKPTANPDLTAQWQTLFYLSTDTNNVVLPLAGQQEQSDQTNRRLLAFFFNKNGQNQLQAEYNKGNAITVNNFKAQFMEKWAFYAFSINFSTKVFKIGINLVDQATITSQQGTFLQNIPANFGVFPNLGLYFDATPAYFPSCSLMQGIVVSANYDFDVATPQHMVQFRHKNLKLIAHYSLMSPNTTNPQLIEDVQFNLFDLVLGNSADVEPTKDPIWTQSKGEKTYQELTFKSGSTAYIKTDKKFEEFTVQYWMTINSAKQFTNFETVDSSGNSLFSIIYKQTGSGYTIDVCIKLDQCFTSTTFTGITSTGKHQAVISTSQFPGSQKLFVKIYINGGESSQGYINSQWASEQISQYVLNRPTDIFTDSYSMRNFKIYSGSYVRQYNNDPGLFTFCNSNCILHGFKQLEEQVCLFCSSGFVLNKGYCWPGEAYCPKANQTLNHDQPYSECTPCLNSFATVKQLCKADIDLNPLVISGMPSTMEKITTKLIQNITFSTNFTTLPQIFISMSTFDYSLDGSTPQNFKVYHQNVTFSSFQLVAECNSGQIFEVQPFYIASVDPDIEIGNFELTDVSNPGLSNVGLSDQWVEQIIYFKKRQKFLPQVSAGYTGIQIQSGSGHCFEILTETVDVDSFKLKVKALQGVPIQRINGYYISMRPEVPIQSIIKDFQKTDEGKIYTQKQCPPQRVYRTVYFTGSAGKVPAETIFIPVITIFNQRYSQGNIRRYLFYEGVDPSKSTFSFKYQTWCDTRTSQFGISSFALVKPCVKFYCDCNPAPPGYYNLPALFACPKCDFKCQYCVDSATNCTKCKGNRLLEKGCTCPEGTYEDFISTDCPPCKFGCLSCVGKADDCNGKCMKNRVGSDCKCPPGTVDDNLTHNCPSVTDIGCDTKCERCSVIDPKICKGCAKGRFEDLKDPSKCNCDINQIDENNVCYNCHERCKGCTGRLPTQCRDCIGITRQNPPYCSCKNGYYDDGISLECQPCNENCVTCSAATNNDCIECKPNRVKNVLTQKCDCPSGTYDSGLPICPGCSNKCFTCKDKEEVCIECAGDRAGAPSCDICPEGKYSGTDINCSKCDSKCATCITTSSNCLVCVGKNRKFNAPYCDCEEGYYETGGQNCMKCEDSCKSCSGGPSQCVTCHDNRILDPITKKCLCPPSYQEIAGQQYCQGCDPQCKTCNALGCTTCAQNREAPPQCTCPFGTFDLLPADVKCLSCHPICNGCTESSTKCLDCKGLRSNKPYCDTCPAGMFPTTDAPDFCSSCNPMCAKCQTTRDNCTECVGNRVRIKDPNSNYYTCLCQSGTYDDLTTTQCRACFANCVTCAGGSRLDCLICKTQFVKSTLGNLPGSCDCPQNTFMTSDGKSCQSCDYKCLTCTGPTSKDCISCRNSADCQTVIDPIKPLPLIDLCRTYAILTDENCECSNQQYFNYSEQKCQYCSENCKTCYGSQNSECTDCIDGYVQQGTKCIKPITQQDSSNTFGWLLLVFLGIICLLTFPFIYLYFMKKIKAKYLKEKGIKLEDNEYDEKHQYQQPQNNISHINTSNYQ